MGAKHASQLCYRARVSGNKEAEVTWSPLRNVLRRFRRNPDAQRVEFQVRFQQHLRRLAQFHAVAETFPDASIVVEYDPPLREWWVRCEENLRALAGLCAGGAEFPAQAADAP